MGDAVGIDWIEFKLDIDSWGLDLIKETEKVSCKERKMSDSSHTCAVSRNRLFFMRMSAVCKLGDDWSISCQSQKSFHMWETLISPGLWFALINIFFYTIDMVNRNRTFFIIE